MSSPSSDITMEDAHWESNEESSTKQESISPHGQTFPQHCMYWNVVVDQPDKLPTNYQHIKSQVAYLLTSYGTPANLQDEFKEFSETCGWAQSKANIVSDVFPFLTRGSGLKARRNIPFDNLEPLTDGTVKVSIPDIFDGSLPEDLHPTVRKAIGERVEPSKMIRSCSVPNLFVEMIAPDEFQEAGARRLIWAGALSSRAMDSILSWTSDVAVPDATASSFSVLFSASGVITKSVDMIIYMHHSIKASGYDIRPWYITTRLDTFSVARSANEYLAAKHTLKAVVEIAQQLRRNAIDAANLKVRSGHPSVR